ncbi:DUF4406 domain-containing protein [Nocardioides kribbensis]|uniref:DUF4406 domain-containing protein n=1 Tax=Nocardioides kribbensis TaxID=305517 RepID=A0ABV1NZ35_9ACTN
MRLYIAGPMTGRPDFNFPAFFAAERDLIAAGHETSNPARNGQGAPDMGWVDYMRRDIADLLTCDGIAILDGWGESRGALLEVHIADALALPVKRVDQWIDGDA